MDRGTQLRLVTMHGLPDQGKVREDRQMTYGTYILGLADLRISKNSDIHPLMLLGI